MCELSAHLSLCLLFVKIIRVPYFRFAKYRSWLRLTEESSKTPPVSFYDCSWIRGRVRDSALLKALCRGMVQEANYAFFLNTRIFQAGAFSHSPVWGLAWFPCLALGFRFLVSVCSFLFPRLGGSRKLRLW